MLRSDPAADTVSAMVHFSVEGGGATLGSDAAAEAIFAEVAAQRDAAGQKSRAEAAAQDRAAKVAAVKEELLGRLRASWGRISDLFRSWDQDGDGMIGRAELKRGLDALGISTTAEEIAAVFSIIWTILLLDDNNYTYTTAIYHIIILYIIYIQ